MSLSTTDRVARHRLNMRAKGFKEYRSWVPDTNAQQFQDAAREQTRAMDAAMQADTDLSEFLAATGAHLMAALDNAGL